jgi:putative endopeptidase
MRNHPSFYEAFDVKPGDRMYLAPEQRVIFW